MQFVKTNLSLEPKNSSPVPFYSGYSFFNLTNVDTSSVEIEIRKIDKRHPNDHENEIDSQFECVGNPQQCTALYLECEPHSNAIRPHHSNFIDSKTISSLIPSKPIIPTIFQNSSIFQNLKPPQKPPINLPDIKPPVVVPPPKIPTIQPDKKPSVVFIDNGTTIPSKPSPISEDEHWPWSVDIFIDGKLLCVGVLLDNTCVLTEVSCMNSVNLEFDYVTVVVGKSQAFMNVVGPYEQVLRVSCFVKLESGSNGVLLFLDGTIRFNRESMPTFLPET